MQHFALASSWTSNLFIFKTLTPGCRLHRLIFYRFLALQDYFSGIMITNHSPYSSKASKTSYSFSKTWKKNTAAVHTTCAAGVTGGSCNSSSQRPRKCCAQFRSTELAEPAKEIDIIPPGLMFSGSDNVTPELKVFSHART